MAEALETPTTSVEIPLPLLVAAVPWDESASVPHLFFQATLQVRWAVEETGERGRGPVGLGLKGATHSHP